MKVWSNVKTALKVIAIIVALIFLRYFVKFYNGPMNGPEEMTGVQRIGEAFLEALVSTLAAIFL